MCIPYNRQEKIQENKNGLNENFRKMFDLYPDEFIFYNLSLPETSRCSGLFSWPP